MTKKNWCYIYPLKIANNKSCYLRIKLYFHRQHSMKLPWMIIDQFINVCKKRNQNSQWNILWCDSWCHNAPPLCLTRPWLCPPPVSPVWSSPMFHPLHCHWLIGPQFLWWPRPQGGLRWCQSIGRPRLLSTHPLTSDQTYPNFPVRWQTLDDILDVLKEFYTSARHFLICIESLRKMKKQFLCQSQESQVDINTAGNQIQYYFLSVNAHQYYIPDCSFVFFKSTESKLWWQASWKIKRRGTRAGVSQID